MFSAAMAAASAMMGQPGLAAAAAAAGNPFLQTPFGMLGTAPRFRWQGADLLGHLQPGAVAAAQAAAAAQQQAAQAPPAPTPQVVAAAAAAAGLPQVIF